MYRFLLFMYDSYYPIGGLSDVELKFNKVDELVEWFNNLDEENDRGIYYDLDNNEIYDTQKDKVYIINEFDNIVEEFEEYLKLGYE